MSLQAQLDLALSHLDTTMANASNSVYLDEDLRTKHQLDLTELDMTSLKQRLEQADKQRSEYRQQANYSWQDVLLQVRMLFAKLGFDPPIAAALFGFIAASLLGLIAAIPLGVDQLGAFVVLIGIVLFTWAGIGFGTWQLIRIPPTIPVEPEVYIRGLITEREKAKVQARDKAIQIEGIVAGLEQSITSLTAAMEEQRIRDQRLVERQRLLYLNWNSLSGEEFELRLKEVYELNGYRVDLTSNSGDQGGDLIVEKRGRRICVQAKRWQASVGNKAVQEAYSGQGFYKCDGCAVVTTSQFTTKAIELAQEINCQLIDSDGLRQMIEGGKGAEIRKLASPPPIESPQPFFEQNSSW